MSVKALIAMSATVAASFAAPTMVQAAQEKPAMQAATPKPSKSGHAAVIGVDLQGHGRTALGDREISLVDMGNDMAGVLKTLGYNKVDVLGYSLGGGVAFQFAA